MRTHELKCWVGYYDAAITGRKPFEIRKNDRAYQVGDELLLKEFVPEQGFTGNESKWRVTYVLDNFVGLTPGYVALGINRIYESVTRESDTNG